MSETSRLSGLGETDSLSSQNLAHLEHLKRVQVTSWLWVRPHLTDICFVKHSQGSWAPGQLALAQEPVTGSAMESGWE